MDDYVVNTDVSRPGSFRVGVVMLFKQGFGLLLTEALWKQKLHEVVWLGTVCRLRACLNLCEVCQWT